MVDIGTSDKITNLWPAPPSRSIENSVLKDKQKKNQHRHKKNKDSTKDKDGPGNNIDEYA